jgi:hypothetical protein
MAKRNTITMRIKSELEKLEERIVHKGGSKVGITKDDKSKNKKARKQEKYSRRINRRH